MAGTIIVDTINSSVASTPPVFQANGTEVGTLCRAWVNFNGTGTVAINASFNVSSITDNGTGDYTVNFTNALPDANYSWVGSTRLSGATTHATGNVATYTKTTTQLRISTLVTSSGAASDPTDVNISVFR
jgi:hypothetical protein